MEDGTPKDISVDTTNLVNVTLVEVPYSVMKQPSKTIHSTNVANVPMLYAVFCVQFRTQSQIMKCIECISMEIIAALVKLLSQ